VSATSQGPGWWLASDGRWYPPETHPLYQPAPPSAIDWATGVSNPPVPQPQQAEDRRHKALALVLLIGGAVCGAIGLVLFAVFAVGGLLDTTVYKTPVHVVVDCRSGTYYVYQANGSQYSGPGFSYSYSGLTTLTPGQVRVVGPNGRPDKAWAASGSDTITKGSTRYSNAVGFDTPIAGNYSVTITPSSPTAVIIAPSLGGQFLSAAPWLIFTGVGFPTAIVGLVLLIRESNRRNRQDIVPGPYGWQPA
jgi:hypothetical protein